MPADVMKVEDRFWSKVDRSGGLDACWPWSAARQPSGYGAFAVNLGRGHWKQCGAHRIAWELANGAPFPEGLFARHACDNPSCCNPRHILPGTPAENMQDKFDRGRDRSQTTNSCYAGHEYTPDNTMSIKGTSWKRCLTCKRAAARSASRAYRERKRSEASGG